jgi:hypothetical protein
VDGRPVKCQIWDTAGQQRFHVITQAYYKGAHGIVLVYDASGGPGSEESFNNVRYWMENINKHASPTCAKLLIGNKSDVKGGKRVRARGRVRRAALPQWSCEEDKGRAFGLTRRPHCFLPIRLACCADRDGARQGARGRVWAALLRDKDGSNVKEAFHTLARDAVRRLRAAGGGGGAEGASDAAKSVKQLKDRRKQVEGGGKDGRDCVVQ